MILQALCRYYDRLIDRQTEGVAPVGYSPEKISFEIVLKPDGCVAQVNDIRDTSGEKPQPRTLKVPQPPKRASNVAPCFLWDKTSYVLGVSNTSKRTAKEHKAFVDLHEAVLRGKDDVAFNALLNFLQHWSQDRFEFHDFPDDMVDTNVVFRLDGEQCYLHDRPSSQAVLASIPKSGERQGTVATETFCLVSGESAVAARLHPAIKGVNGAQSSGASIVSFNQEAFTSYGKDQGDNAPTSEKAAFAYSTALNYLLRRGAHNRQRLQVGDTTVVFWAEAMQTAQAVVAENTLFAMLSPPADDASEAARIRSILELVAKGRPVTDLAPELEPATRMYVLGLAPNASRLSIRFWQVDTLGTLLERIAQHAADLHLEPQPWATAPSAWRLALATSPSRWSEQKKRYEQEPKNIPPQLAGELLRAILSGGPYPRSILSNTIMRFRADGDVSGVRVALCKGVLTRDRRRNIYLFEEEIPVSLNKQSKQPGYLLGRLFAVLENTQRAALGGHINATIRDRYYGAASATPATVFPVLLRNTQNHLGKLRKERVGQAVNLEKEIRGIVSNLPEEFPRSLKIEDQGCFAIGYYHQSQSYFSRRDAAGEDSTDPNN